MPSPIAAARIAVSRRWGASLVAAVTLGLLAPTAPAGAAGGTTPPPGCHRSWPVVAHYAGGVAARLPAAARLPVACATSTGYAASESTLGVTPNGTLIYSPAETENSVARSTDNGRTWQLAYPAQEQYTSFWNTVDPDLVVDRRTGWVFWAHATGPLRNEGTLPYGTGFALAAAYGFQVYTSRDAGRTFTTADYSTAPTGDWEKIFVGPPPARSTGAPQPTGYPDIVYLCANSPVEVSGPGRLCYKSLDGGSTFSPIGYVFPSASEPPDYCPPLDANNAVVGNAGTIYLPVTCDRASYLVVSRDEGTSWTWHVLPAAPPGSDLQVAVDDADTLYALWLSNDHLYLAISRTHALSWGPALDVTAPGVRGIAFPAFAATGRGEVGIVYYGSKAASAQSLSAYVTVTNTALATHPLFYSGPINDPAQPIFHDYGTTLVLPRVDFVGCTFDAHGTFLAGVVKQLGPATNPYFGTVATVGYVGRLVFPGSSPHPAVMLPPAKPPFPPAAPSGPPRAAAESSVTGSDPAGWAALLAVLAVVGLAVASGRRPTIRMS